MTTGITRKMADYPVPAAPVEAELEIKKSRFIAFLYPVQERAQLLARVDDLRQTYPDARHHCWAYLVGNPAGACSAGMNDDGEPSGTAGKPILNVLQHSGLGDVGIVVVRYFGGVKLGAGGLVRAYSGAAQQVVEAVKITKAVSMFRLRLTLDFSREQILRHWLAENSGEMLEIHYEQKVRAVVAIAEKQHDNFVQFAAAQQITCKPSLPIK